MTAALALLGVVAVVSFGGYALGRLLGWLEATYGEVDE